MSSKHNMRLFKEKDRSEFEKYALDADKSDKRLQWCDACRISISEARKAEVALEKHPWRYRKCSERSVKVAHVVRTRRALFEASKDNSGLLTKTQKQEQKKVIVMDCIMCRECSESNIEHVEMANASVEPCLSFGPILEESASVAESSSNNASTIGNADVKSTELIHDSTSSTFIARPHSDADSSKRRPIYRLQTVRKRFRSPNDTILKEFQKRRRTAGEEFTLPFLQNIISDDSICTEVICRMHYQCLENARVHLEKIPCSACNKRVYSCNAVQLSSAIHEEEECFRFIAIETLI